MLKVIFVLCNFFGHSCCKRTVAIATSRINKVAQNTSLLPQYRGMIDAFATALSSVNTTPVANRD